MASQDKKGHLFLTFDIEDWFQVKNMEHLYPHEKWEDLENRVDVGVDFLLNELKKKNVKATFYIVGWLAERYPELVRKISNQGHEISTHGYAHRSIDQFNKETFREDLKKSIDVIQKITGKKVLGYRAPSFSVTKKTWWALDVIRELGLEYDTSIFCTRHPEYGVAGFTPEIQKVEGVTEVPLFNGKFLGLNLPVAGGGYFRLLPYAITKHVLKKVLKDRNMVMYFHPWEFDPNQPKINLSPLKKFRHYIGLKRNQRKFQKLLSDFNFLPLENYLKVQGHILKYC